ncbi:MAG: restriction endonuclease [Candidatus Pristimantibacillus lignocellulolyticus]|uniref:Restriction endonuclease n=1 Tax=Candidatus Pristimantibacillus lignocellulolyticus TaxID=2994561 RepID=A0A9J6ZI62_9BACL|nr:MAG: restriction endonuclease [Candidatus Pristimantibacillus lignocellulolyticus]
MYYTDNYNTLDEWVNLVLSGKEVYPSLRIPCDEWVEELIEGIENRSTDYVKDILRCLLCPITRGIDVSDYKTYLLLKDSDNEAHKDFAKDMFYSERYKRLANGQDAWEGLTWIIELLPHSPYKAIRALESYIYSQPSLPDDRIYGGDQCIQIIVAKFINFENSLEHLTKLKPVEFEWLIENLYESMGYETVWTTATRDGGKDVIATIERTDGEEQVYVECKLYKTTKLELNTVRAFRDVILENKVNRGVIFCTGYVNDNIRNFDKRIQIWTFEDINVLFNAHLGSDWVNRLAILIENKRRKYGRKREKLTK